MASTKKSISQKKMDRERQDNQVLNRVYYVFLLGLAAECYLFVVYRGYNAGTVNSMLAWNTALKVLMWIGLAVFAAGVIGTCVKRTDRKLRGILSWAAAAGGFFAVSGWLTTHFFNNGAGLILSCVLVAVAAILSLIGLLYQHECTLNTAALGGALFSVWARGGSFLSDSWAVPVILGCVLGLVLLAAAAYLAVRAQKDGGRLWKVQVFSPDCDYRILYAALAVAAAGVLIALLVPSISVYLMWMLGVALFAELVFYTTKLM